MNNLLKIARHIPVTTEVPVISVSPLSLPAPDRGMDLEVRISAPVTGQNLPVILLSHGHGPSLYIPSADDYGPIISFWAAHGFVVIQPTKLNAKARGMKPDAPGGPTFWKSRVTDMTQIIDRIDDPIGSVPGLVGRVDTSKIAVAGHSLGGQTAGMLLGARVNDPNDPNANDPDMSDPRIMAGISAIRPNTPHWRWRAKVCGRRSCACGPPVHGAGQGRIRPDRRSGASASDREARYDDPSDPQLFRAGLARHQGFGGHRVVAKDLVI